MGSVYVVLLIRITYLAITIVTRNAQGDISCQSTPSVHRVFPKLLYLIPICDYWLSHPNVICHCYRKKIQHCFVYIPVITLQASHSKDLNNGIS